MAKSSLSEDSPYYINNLIKDFLRKKSKLEEHLINVQKTKNPSDENKEQFADYISNLYKRYRSSFLRAINNPKCGFANLKNIVSSETMQKLEEDTHIGPRKEQISKAIVKNNPFFIKGMPDKLKPKERAVNFLNKICRDNQPTIDHKRQFVENVSGYKAARIRISFIRATRDPECVFGGIEDLVSPDIIQKLFEGTKISPRKKTPDPSNQDTSPPAKRLRITNSDEETASHEQPQPPETEDVSKPQVESETSKPPPISTEADDLDLDSFFCSDASNFLDEINPNFGFEGSASMPPQIQGFAAREENKGNKVYEL